MLVYIMLCFFIINRGIFLRIKMGIYFGMNVKKYWLYSDDDWIKFYVFLYGIVFGGSILYNRYLVILFEMYIF